MVGRLLLEWGTQQALEFQIETDNLQKKKFLKMTK